MGYIVNELRTLFWTSFYYLMGWIVFRRIGAGCRFQGWIDIPQHGGIITLGSNVLVGRSVEFSVPRGGHLSIGHHALIGRGALISAHKSIEIGDHVMIAEYVCIHDNNHRFDDANILISEQGFVSLPILIGTGTWIGAHSVIVCGGTVGKNAVVGAGSVLNRVMPDSVVVAGVPAKVVRQRVFL